MFLTMSKVISLSSNILFSYSYKNNLFLERYVRAVDNGDEFQYEEVPIEDFYDDGISSFFYETLFDPLS